MKGERNMDKLEKSVERNRTQNDAEEREKQNVPDDADITHPALKSVHDKMVSSHQRKMQQLAAKEKEFDRQLQQMSAMQAMMQNQQQPAARQNENGNGNAHGEFDWLEEEVKPLLNDPDASRFRALLRSIDKRTRPQENPEVGELRNTVKALQAELQNTVSTVTQERYMRQIPDFKKKFGGALDEDQQRQVLEFALHNKTDLETALLNVNRETFLAQERALMKSELKKQMETEWGASLEGMSEFVSSEPNPNRSPVTKEGKLVPFADTAVDVLGKMGFARAMREGFDRSEGPTPQED